MDTVKIASKSYSEDFGWTVIADVEVNGYRYGGPHTVVLPETATDKQLEDAILAQYK